MMQEVKGQMMVTLRLGSMFGAQVDHPFNVPNELIQVPTLGKKNKLPKMDL